MSSKSPKTSTKKASSATRRKSVATSATRRKSVAASATRHRSTQKTSARTRIRNSLPPLSKFEAPLKQGLYFANDVKPIYPNVGFRNFQQVSKLQRDAHSEYTESDYYTEEVAEIGRLTASGMLRGVFECPSDNIYVNNCAMNYIKSRPTSKILTFFDTDNNIINFINNRLSTAGAVITYKTVTMSHCAALGLFYQVSYQPNNPPNWFGLCKFAEKFGVHVNPKPDWPLANKNETTMNVTCVVLENVNPHAMYKILDKSPFKCYNTNTFPRVIELAGVFFNKNSLDFLELQNLKRMVMYGQNTCSQNISTFKRILYENFNQQYINKFLILSGGMLYTYGTRLCTDVDFFISPYPSNTGQGHEYMDSIAEKFFLDDASRPEMFDGYMPDKRWKSFWTEWHGQWAGTIGAKSMIECIHNPKYHYYFMGLKFIILQAEINRRNIRNRQNAIADLLMIKKFTGLEFKIDTIVKEVIRSEVRIVRTDKMHFARRVQINIWERYGVRYDLKDILAQLTFDLS